MATIPNTNPEALARRFWARVSKQENGCWLWTGSRTVTGYGTLKRGYAHQYVHRISWEMAHGEPPPSDLAVCHRCDVRNCVNPAHLFLGTQADNLRDMRSKGRAASQAGENHSKARLTWAEVRDIRSRAKAGEHPAAIAKAKGITKAHVYNIIAGRIWREVEGGDPNEASSDHR